MRPGVRCADTTPTSNGTSNSASACAASSITDQSLSLPMITPTRGWGALVMSTPSVGPLGVRQPVCGPGRTFPHIGDVRVVAERASGAAQDVDVADLAAGALALAVQVNPGLRHAAEQVMQPLVDA